VSWSLASGLDGKGVIVTGASGGIGSAVARAFASAGARVLATDVDQAPLDELVAGLDGDGHLAISADLRLLESHDGLVEHAVDAFGGLDVLVNLAAVVRRQYDLEEVTEADWDFQLDINLKAAFFLCRRAARAMVDAGRGGRIVTFSSQAWWTGGYAGSTAYAASKGGVVSMTRGLARAYGSHGITVNSVSPGLVDTPMISTDMDPEAFETMARQIPLGHVAVPDDIAGVVLFLASDHARYVTGATINVSGGMLMY
jgi:NAD(P)-dependent dehydrogenase (short-subunit alcohol dehydrogenase family)